MRLISALILVFFLIAAHGANNPHTFDSHSALHDDTKNAQEFPVIYGKKDDGFPVNFGVASHKKRNRMIFLSLR